ncbi:hypothetical protein D3C87_1959080 [compost metagenome]
MRVSFSNHLKDVLILAANLVQVNLLAVVLLDRVQRHCHNGQCTQPQEVHLEQTDFLAGPHIKCHDIKYRGVGALFNWCIV